MVVRNDCSLKTPNVKELQGKSLGFKAMYLVCWKQTVQTHLAELCLEDEKGSRLVQARSSKLFEADVL
jgi:hypothetical protein